MSLTITLTQTRETKNTIRYEERNDPPAIGILYIQKHALKAAFNTYPQSITVTVGGV